MIPLLSYYRFLISSPDKKISDTNPFFKSESLNNDCPGYNPLLIQKDSITGWNYFYNYAIQTVPL